MKTAKTQREGVTKTLNQRPCSETPETICGSWDYEVDTDIVKEYCKKQKERYVLWLLTSFTFQSPIGASP